jgi:hypothetical protein
LNARLILVLAVSLLGATTSRADEVKVLFNGTEVGSWDAGRDAERLKKELSVSEVNAVTNPPALEWRFVPRSVLFNDLFLHRPIAQDFTSIRLGVRNEGAALALAAKTREASGAQWTRPGDNLRSFQADFDERATRVFMLK